MIVKAFAVYDSKATAYMSPFFFPHAGQAIRAFSDTVNDPSTSLNRHPGDFTLFQIGEFDDETGVFTATSPVNLGTALNYRQQPSAPLFDERVSAPDQEEA